jgi:uncharacterized protein (TIGR02271 family)
MSDPLSVSGVFEDQASAQAAVDALREAGFHQEVIDVKQPESKLFDALLPEEERDRKTTVTVVARERRLEAGQILQRSGGHDIDAGDEPTGESAAQQNGGDQRVPLYEEELVPRTVAVQTGELRIRKRIVTENRMIEVPIRREEVVVERVTVPHAQSIITEEARTTEEAGMTEEGRLQTEEPITELGADQDITRIPLREEQIVLQKRVVVREYVTVTKRIVEQTRQVSGTIRREEPRVETQGNAPVAAADGVPVDEEPVAVGPIDGGQPSHKKRKRHH